MEIKELIKEGDTASLYLTECGKVLQHVFCKIDGLEPGAFTVYEPCNEWTVLGPPSDLKEI